MNWEQIKGGWNPTEGTGEAAVGKLTDDDLSLIEGRRDELIGRLQARYGYAKEQAEQRGEILGKETVSHALDPC